MKMTKTAKQLPQRSALNALGQTQRTINDYAKATPIAPAQPTPTVVQNLRKPR